MGLPFGVSQIQQAQAIVWGDPGSGEQDSLYFLNGQLCFGARGGVNLSPPSNLATQDIVSNRTITATNGNTRFEPWQLIFTNLSTDATNPGGQIYRGITSLATQGSASVAATGTLLSSRLVVTVTKNGNTLCEFSPQMIVVRSDEIAGSSPGDYWIGDYNSHGPINLQPRLLAGLSVFANNYYNGSPSLTKGTALAISAFAGGGGGAGPTATPPDANGVNHLTATTYPYDIGLLVVGASGVPAVNAGVGFTTAIQVGGGTGTSDAGPWTVSASHIGTGLHIRDFQTNAIAIDNIDGSNNPSGVVLGTGGTFTDGFSTASATLLSTGAAVRTGVGQNIAFGLTGAPGALWHFRTAGGGPNSGVPALLLESDSFAPTYRMDTYVGSAQTSLQFRRALGSLASPTQTTANTIFGRISGMGWHTDGSPGFNSAQVAIDLIANEAVTSTNRGSRIDFFTTVNAGSTLTNRYRMDNDGSFTPVLSGALATNATGGFMSIATCAGTPTGSVTNYTGCGAMVYDTTNHKLWVNEGGTTWKGVVLS